MANPRHVSSLPLLWLARAATNAGMSAHKLLHLLLTHAYVLLKSEIKVLKNQHSHINLISFSTRVACS